MKEMGKKMLPTPTELPSEIWPPQKIWLKRLRNTIYSWVSIVLTGTKKKRRKKNSSSGSSVSTLSTSEIEAIIFKLKGERHRDSTRGNYYCIWKLFNSFYLKLDNKPATWEQCLILFVAYLIEQKRKSSTIRSYISTIKAVLADINVTLNENTFLLNSLIKACKLQNNFVQLRLPIYKKMLNMLLKTTKNHYLGKGQVYLGHLYCAMLVARYYGLLRIGEIMAGPHTIKVTDVHIGQNKNKILFVLRMSKTHNKGNKLPLVEIISNGFANNNRQKEFCLFALIAKYLQMRKPYHSKMEPFFVYSDHSSIQPDAFRKMLKAMLGIAGFNNEAYRGHSLHVGHAGDLLKYGVSVETIKKLGKWKSNSVYTYLSLQTT